MISGGIICWSGSIASIPAGYVLCNGAKGTPDLRNRFIVGANADDGGIAKSSIDGSPKQTGGSVQHDHTTSSTGTCTLGAGTALGAGGVYDNEGGSVSTGTTTTELSVPPFYALAYIMKV